MSFLQRTSPFWRLACRSRFMRKALKGLSTQKGLHQNYTRRVPPFLGIFGIFGLWGFSGFWTYYAHGIVSPFLLFALFGLFGLFFEGKLSHTLEDELFQHNKARADLKAYKTGFLLVAVILLSRWRVLALHAVWCAILLLISVSLIVAFVRFQKRYPLEKAQYNPSFQADYRHLKSCTGPHRGYFYFHTVG